MVGQIQNKLHQVHQVIWVWTTDDEQPNGFTLSSFVAVIIDMSINYCSTESTQLRHHSTFNLLMSCVIKNYLNRIELKRLPKTRFLILDPSEKKLNSSVCSQLMRSHDNTHYTQKGMPIRVYVVFKFEESIVSLFHRSKDWASFHRIAHPSDFGWHAINAEEFAT